MITKFTHWLFTLIILAVIIGCSKGHLPIVPEINDISGDGTALTSDPQAQSSSENSRVLLLYNLLYIDPSDPENIKVENIPLREAGIHLNILKFLEDGPCFDCFRIVGFNLPEPGILDVDIQIDHPFDVLDFSVFDVRGIIMFHGSHEFPATGKSISDPALGDGALLNPDGYTALFNGPTIFSPVGDLQKYYIGNFSSPAIPSADINGFKYYTSDDPANNRNAFYGGSSDIQTFSLKLPTGPFALGYAVDANWWIPIETPVDDPLTDFDLNANCPEPWKIVVSGDPIGQSGETTLTIDIFDWQGMETHTAPMLECPDLWDNAKAANFVEEGDGYSRWERTVQNAKGAGIGEYKCLIWTLNDVEDPLLDVNAYQVLDISVVWADIGWARTWGGDDEDHGRDITVDMLGNIYVAGNFGGTVDFNPGQDIFESISKGKKDIFLCKFDSMGEFLWVRTFGGIENDGGHGIAVDEDNNIFVCGSFQDTVDFDPGSGVDTHISGANSSAFLSKFDSGGEFLWTLTWFGEGTFEEDYDNCAKDVVTDNLGNTFVTGYQYRFEFPCTLGNEAFLKKIGPAGNIIFDLIWGDLSDEHGTGVALDNSGNIYVTGFYKMTVDFDPGPGEDFHESGFKHDAFLSKFNSLGEYQWVRTWGGWDKVGPEGVDVDELGNIYVTGWYYGDSQKFADFDPGEGQDLRMAAGYADAFLSKFDANGNFSWAHTWGAGDTSNVHFPMTWWYADLGYDVITDDFGNCYVTGYFSKSVDFDPSESGTSNETAIGKGDAYLTKFNIDGEFQWVRTWGDDDICCDEDAGYYFIDCGTGLSIDDFNNIYMSGFFSDNPLEYVDFDPGSEIDAHYSNGQTDAFILKILPNGYWE